MSKPIWRQLPIRILIGNCLKKRIKVHCKSQSGQSGNFHAVPITQAEAPDTDILTLPFHQKTCDHKTLTLVLIIVFAIIVMDHDNFFMKTVD